MRIECPKCHAAAEIDDAKLPEGRFSVKCKKCANAFFVEATVLPIAQVKVIDGFAHLHCPHCKKHLKTDSQNVEENATWNCPACKQNFRLGKISFADEQNVSPNSKNTSPNNANTAAVSQNSNNAAQNIPHENKTNFPTFEDNSPTYIIDDGTEQLPRLSDKDRYTGHFLVRINSSDFGPVSYNVLENWARTGRINAETLVAILSSSPNDSTHSANTLFKAGRFPELLPIFLGTNITDRARALKEILQEETTGHIISKGVMAGLIGGAIGGLIIAPAILFRLWQPTIPFPPALSAIIFAVGASIIGAGFGSVNAVLGIWLIEYPWTAAVQLILAFVLAIMAFATTFFGANNLDLAIYNSIGVFVISFLLAYATALIHRKYYETIE